MTGGTGFIGSRLVADLSRRGHRIVVLTRSLAKAERLGGLPRVRALELDPLRPDGLLEALGRVHERVEVVFHLAANQWYLGPRAVSYRDNVAFARNLLEWSAGRSVRTFVFTSTLDVLGPARTGTESRDEEAPCHPVSTYGWAKREAEKAVGDFASRPGATPRVLTLRLGNVYGPGSRFLVGDIVRALSEGESHPIHRYYHQIRRSLVHPCHVDDVVRCLSLAAAAPLRSGELVNVSGRRPVTVEGLVGLIAEASGLEFRPPPERRLDEARVALRSAWHLHVRKKADPVTYFRLGHWYLSTEKARAVLGFEEGVSLAEGIRSTLQSGRGA